MGTPAQAVGLEAGAPGPRSQVGGREAGTSVMATWLRLLESMGALGLGGLWLNLLDPVHPIPSSSDDKGMGEGRSSLQGGQTLLSCPFQAGGQHASEGPVFWVLQIPHKQRRCSLT